MSDTLFVLSVAIGFLVVGYVMGRIAAKPVIIGQAKEYDPGDSTGLYDDDPYREALEGPNHSDKEEREKT